MKKRVILALSLLSLAPLFGYNGEGSYTAQTYYSDIPLFMSASPERISLVRDQRMILREDGRGGFFEAVVFGGASTQPTQIGEWFFPYHRTSLIVAEGADGELTTTPNDRMVDANHFNIATEEGTFRSVISICPKQTFSGVGFLGQKAFCYDRCGDPKWYGEISIPVVHKTNDLRFTETPIDEGGGLPDPVPTGLDGAPMVANMIQAFNQPAMLYGKICGPCCKMSKTGVADIELKIGYNKFNCEIASIAAYGGLIVPTSNKANDGGDWSGYMWQPIIGNGKHFGVMWGTDMRFSLCEWECSALTFYSNSNSRFLFSNDQIRSVDVYDKSWSHYMEMYASQTEATAAIGSATAGSFGANVLSTCVQVNPRFSFATNAALMYERQHFVAELGYHFFARQAEELKLKNFNGAPAFKAAVGNGLVTTARTISHRYPGSDIPNALYTNAVITSADLNLNSAGHPALIAHTMYATFGYQWNDYCYPTMVGIGGSYQFSSTNSAIDRWMLWGKIGVSF